MQTINIFMMKMQIKRAIKMILMSMQHISTQNTTVALNIPPATLTYFKSRYGKPSIQSRAWMVPLVLCKVAAPGHHTAHIPKCFTQGGMLSEPAPLGSCPVTWGGPAG